jgi:CheY-like chemotaxis protein
MSQDREKSLSAGCDDYISKPIKPLALLNLIEKYF